MLPYRNLEILASIIFFVVTKIVCGLVTWYRGMYSKRPTLTSIPEHSEYGEDLTSKWVPKKKHEVLKAKYKCLKKLFQIYDASVIGILPETCANDAYLDEEAPKRRKKKRTHKTKSDACAGTTDTSGDIQQTTSEETGKISIMTSLIRDLNVTEQSCTSTQIDGTLLKDNKVVGTQDSKEAIHVEQDCEATQTVVPLQHPIPYLVLNEKRRLTRFQCFIHRILGIRSERGYKNYVMPNGHTYACSDNSFTHNYNYNCSEKRRRRGLRFRRLKRTKKIQSESALRDLDSTSILTCMQVAQKCCLNDTTLRHCPIVGCTSSTNGIINYNDHLVLSHFPERKHMCHYCHEGFEKEIEKFVHENEHIGINKLGLTGSAFFTPISRQSSQRVAKAVQIETIEKCAAPEEKMKKVLSFFGKTNDTDESLNDIKKHKFSECNMNLKTVLTDDPSYGAHISEKETAASCMHVNKIPPLEKYCAVSMDTLKLGPSTPVICHFCGEGFNYRRQLSIHLELDHGEEKLMPHHNRAGLLSSRSSHHVDMVSEDGKINVQSFDRSLNRINHDNTSLITSCSELSRRRSDDSLSYDSPSNIVYNCTSMESVERDPPLGFEKARVCNSYKWEPGTKIIHV